VKRCVYTLEKEVPKTMINDCDSKMLQKRIFEGIIIVNAKEEPILKA